MWFIPLRVGDNAHPLLLHPTPPPQARKAGIAPAAIDADGKEINPHIPQYMTKGLWYLNQTESTTLMHQKNWRNESEGEGKQWYDRGAKVFQATKFRKGACENCGAMTHKTRDCLERPRKVGAKFTGKHIAADEAVQDISLGTFDAKRDRYNGYDAGEYAKVVERYERIEEIRRERKQKEMRDKKYGEGADADAKDDEDRLDEAEARR